MNIQNSAISNVNFQSTKTVKKQEKTTGAKISHQTENLVSGAVCLSAITMGILALKGKLKASDLANAGKEAAEKAAKEAAEKTGKEAAEKAAKEAQEIINNGGSTKEARALKKNLTHAQKKEVQATISETKGKVLKEQQEHQEHLANMGRDVQASGGKIENLNQSINTATSDELKQIAEQAEGDLAQTKEKVAKIIEEAEINPSHQNKLNARRAQNELTSAEKKTKETIEKAEAKAKEMQAQAELKNKHIAEQQASAGYESGQEKMAQNQTVTDANKLKRTNKKHQEQLNKYFQEFERKHITEAGLNKIINSPKSTPIEIEAAKSYLEKLSK